MKRPTRAYLAARFSRAAEIDEIAEWMREAGIEVTSRWHDGSHASSGAGNDLDHPDMVRFAKEDLADVWWSDVVVSFTKGGGGRGGRHVEFGFGVAYGKRLIVVGPREHVFHALPEVEVVEDYLDAVDLLIGERATGTGEKS